MASAHRSPPKDGFLPGGVDGASILSLELLPRRQRQRPLGALGVVPLDVVLADRQHRGQQDVPDGGDHQQRDHPAAAAVDHLHLVEQLGDGHRRDDRRALEQADHLVGGIGQDRPHGLRQDDLEELPALRDAQRRGRFQLTLVDRDDAGPDDLRRIGGLVQGRDRCTAAAIPLMTPFTSKVKNDGPNGMPMRQRLVQVGDVEPEQQLHDQRDGAERPDVGPGDRLQDGIFRQPADGQRDTEREAENRSVDGQLDGQPQRLEHRRRGEVLGEGGPVPARIGDQAVDELATRIEHAPRMRPTATGGGTCTTVSCSGSMSLADSISITGDRCCGRVSWAARVVVTTEGPWGRLGRGYGARRKTGLGLMQPDVPRNRGCPVLKARSALQVSSRCARKLREGGQGRSSRQAHPAPGALERSRGRNRLGQG